MSRRSSVSAEPWIAASGVRSSCETVATRTISRVVCSRRSASSLIARASSPTMPVFRVETRFPVSPFRSRAQRLEQGLELPRVDLLSLFVPQRRRVLPAAGPA
jgi:hypothetical protein